MNRVETLDQAERLLRQVRSTLNRKKDECPCCERVTYQNWDEAQMYDRLSACLSRCKTLREWMTRKDLVELTPAPPSSKRTFLSSPSSLKPGTPKQHQAE